MNKIISLLNTLINKWENSINKILNIIRCILEKRFMEIFVRCSIIIIGIYLIYFIVINLLPILAIFIRKIFLNIIYIIIFWMLLVLNRALEAWNLNSKRTNHLGNQHLDYNVVPNIVRQLITMKYIK